MKLYKHIIGAYGICESSKFKFMLRQIINEFKRYAKYYPIQNI